MIHYSAINESSLFGLFIIALPKSEYVQRLRLRIKSKWEGESEGV